MHTNTAIDQQPAGLPQPSIVHFFSHFFHHTLFFSSVLQSWVSNPDTVEINHAIVNIGADLMLGLQSSNRSYPDLGQLAKAHAKTLQTPLARLDSLPPPSAPASNGGLAPAAPNGSLSLSIAAPPPPPADDEDDVSRHVWAEKRSLTPKPT